MNEEKYEIGESKAVFTRDHAGEVLLIRPGDEIKIIKKENGEFLICKSGDDEWVRAEKSEIKTKEDLEREAKKERLDKEMGPGHDLYREMGEGLGDYLYGETDLGQALKPKKFKHPDGFRGFK